MLPKDEPDRLPASGIPISLFREILIWPLALHLSDEVNEANAIAKAVQRAAERIAAERGHWHLSPIRALGVTGCRSAISLPCSAWALAHQADLASKRHPTECRDPYRAK